MYVVRDIIKSKPGKIQALVEKFEATVNFIDATKVWGVRVLTDTVANYWTMVIEWEVEELDDYFSMNEDRRADPRWVEAMAGYLDLVESGHREIMQVETAWTKSELTVGD